MKAYNAGQENSRANEALRMEKERLKLEKKAMQQQQQLQQQNKNDIIQNNGIAWNNFDENMKIFYLLGFVSAAQHVSMGSYAGTQDFNDKENKQIKQLADRILSDQGKKEKNKKMMFTKDEMQLWGKAIINLKDDSQNNVLGRYMLPKITIGQIRNGLDVLYKEIMNVSISIPDAIYVVKKQIEGLSNEDTEKILLYLRAGKANPDILAIKNTEGKIVGRLSFP